MAKYFIEDTTLKAIADAIRAKTKDSGDIATLNMPEKIASIKTNVEQPTISIQDETLTILGEGAYYYNVYVNYEYKGTTYTGSYDLSILGLGIGTYHITAESVSEDGIKSSHSIPLVYIIYPVTPTISVLGEKLTIVGEDADYQLIFVNGIGKTATFESTFDLSTISLDEGTYEISVVSSKFDGTRSRESDSVSYTRTNLFPPIISISDSVLNILGSNSDYYFVYVDGNKVADVSKDESNYDLSQLDLTADFHYVTATSASFVNGEIKESLQSDSVIYNAPPKSPEIRSYILSDGEHYIGFNSYEGTESLIIYIDGVENRNIKAEIGITYIPVSEFELSFGRHIFTAVAVSKFGATSKVSEDFYYVIVEYIDFPAPTIYLADEYGTLAIETDQDGTLWYRIYVNGSFVYESTFVQKTVANLSQLGFSDISTDGGNYKITARIARYEDKLFGNESDTVYYTNIVRPSIAINGDILTIKNYCGHVGAMIYVDAVRKYTMSINEDTTEFDLNKLSLDNGTYEIFVVTYNGINGTGIPKDRQSKPLTYVVQGKNSVYGNFTYGTSYYNDSSN